MTLNIHIILLQLTWARRLDCGDYAIYIQILLEFVVLCGATALWLLFLYHEHLWVCWTCQQTLAEITADADGHLAFVACFCTPDSVGQSAQGVGTTVRGWFQQHSCRPPQGSNELECVPPYTEPGSLTPLVGVDSFSLTQGDTGFWVWQEPYTSTLCIYKNPGFQQCRRSLLFCGHLHGMKGRPQV